MVSDLGGCNGSLSSTRSDRDTANGARNNFFAALGKAMAIGPDSTSA